MGNRNWPATTLKGEQQVIPRACPNCLAPTAVSYRYAYQSPLWFLSRTTYYQTFHYCAGCEPMMNAWLKYANIKGWMFFILFGAAVAGGLVGGALAGVGNDAGVATGAIAVPLLVLVLFFTLRTRAKARLPRRPEQIVAWGPAAYYVGSPFLSFGSGQVYRAARAEWIQELVRQNPDSVADDEYARVVGAPKPPPPIEIRPFRG